MFFSHQSFLYLLLKLNFARRIFSDFFALERKLDFFLSFFFGKTTLWAYYRLQRLSFKLSWERAEIYMHYYLIDFRRSVILSYKINWILVMVFALTQDFLLLHSLLKIFFLCWVKFCQITTNSVMVWLQLVIDFLKIELGKQANWWINRWKIIC